MEQFSVSHSYGNCYILDNSSLLKEYGRINYEHYGSGVIVINLLLLKTGKLDELDLLNTGIDKSSEPTVHQPISYLPQANFWFKMINLKIQKKHQIDLKTKAAADETCVVFIKDDALQYFSIYLIKHKIPLKSLAD